jgi:hypothetical protein
MRNIPKCLVIFVIIFSKCSFHFEFWERITPRCLWLVDKGILLPLKENSMLSIKFWHKGLIHKMNSYGIQGKLMKWFENYLFKRRQTVINKNSWSSFEPVSAGVPQGSVYKLFVPLIYLHNLLKISGDNWRVGMCHPFWKLQ